MKEEKNRKAIIMILTISSILVVLGVTYAAFVYTGKGTKENSVTTGDVSFVYNETSNGISITNAYPMNDEKGKVLTDEGENVTKGYFDFNVESTMGASTIIPYYVYAVDMTEEDAKKLDTNYVKIYLTDQDESAIEGYEEVPVYADLDDITAQEDGEEVKGKLLYQDTFYESGTKEFRLRLWVSDEYEVKEESEKFKMRVDVNTEAEVIPKDQNKPTCSIENAQPQTAGANQDISMTIKCTDDNGTVTSNMTSENIHVLLNNEEVEPTKKELSEGIAATEVTGENGIQHNLTLSGFEKDGPLSIKIDSGVITDQYKNTNDEQELSTNVKIDATGPVCTLEDYFPTKTITKDKTLELTISCTDENGIGKDLTSDGIKIKVGEDEETELTKEIKNTESIDQGNKYTVEIKGFTKTGKIEPIINADSLQDTLENPNKETTLDMDLEISNTPEEDFEENANSSSTPYTEDTKHNMFEIEHDGVTEYRYIGDDPYNYVQIDGESSLWRIIGVVEDENSSGKKEARIKLMRDENIGSYSWDNKTQGTGSNLSSSYGSNNWNDSTLRGILNTGGAYYEKKNGTCSTGKTLGTSKACDFSTTGLSSTLKGKIENMKWYLGGMQSFSNFTTSDFYNGERGSETCITTGSCSSEKTRETTGTGYVGLMYPSDYGFTFSNGVNQGCYDKPNQCYSGGSSTSTPDPTKSWIYKQDSSSYQWTLSPNSNYPYYVLFVHPIGNFGNGTAYSEIVVRPVVYLKSGTTLGGGDGQKTSPYTIEEKTDAAIDLESPICSIESITPQNPTQEDEVQIKINCTDNSGKVIEKSALTKEDIEVKISGETSSATKELNKTSSTDNEIKYTLTLNGFEKAGSLSINIPANKIYDESGNSNIETSLTVGSIRAKINNLIVNSKDIAYSDDTKHDMFEFEQPDGSTGYRYIGDDPYNYVKMNDDNSIWRIIGVFNDPDSTGSKTQQRIKLIKDQSVGEKAWDTNNKNNWTRPATLQSDLNSGSTYSSLSATLKGKIEEMKWYLGGYDGSSPRSTENIFKQERGSKGGGSAASTTTWDGYVGLMYPSDYGYTYANGVSNCYTDFYNTSASACSSANAAKGWIRIGHESEYQWTLTPYSDDVYHVNCVHSTGRVNSAADAAGWTGAVVRPVVYLQSGVSFSGGSGTSGDPYILK